MNIAIVGTSKNMTENEERDVRQYCGNIINLFNKSETIIISGGAKGVDTIAKDVAQQLGFMIIEMLPRGTEWTYYQERNLEIAKFCDELYCITIPYYKDSDRIKCYHHKKLENHQKTAGCYTLEEAKKLGKKVTLYVTPIRS